MLGYNVILSKNNLLLVSINILSPSTARAGSPAAQGERKPCYWTGPKGGSGIQKKVFRGYVRTKGISTWGVTNVKNVNCLKYSIGGLGEICSASLVPANKGLVSQTSTSI